MAWTHPNSSQTSGTNSTGTITAAALGSTPTPGNLLVAWVCVDINATLTSNNGYTAHSTGAAGVGRKGQFFTKIAGASESTTPSWSFTTASSHNWTVTVHEYANTDGIYTVLADDAVLTSSGTNHVSPTIIPVPLAIQPDNGAFSDVRLFIGFVIADGAGTTSSWSGYTTTGDNLSGGTTELSDRGIGSTTGVGSGLATVVITSANGDNPYSTSATSTRTDVGGVAILAIQGEIETYSLTAPITSTSQVVTSHNVVPTSTAPLTSVGHLGPAVAAVTNTAPISSNGDLNPVGAIGVQATFTSVGQLGAVTANPASAATFTSVGQLVVGVANITNQASLTSTAALVVNSIQAYDASSAFTSTGQLGPINVAVGVVATFTSVGSIGTILAVVTTTAVFTSTSVLGPGSVGINNSSVITSTSTISVSVLVLAIGVVSLTSNSTITTVASITATAVITSVGHLGPVIVGIEASATLTSISTFDTISIIVSSTAPITSTSSIVVVAIGIGTTSATITSVGQLVVTGVQSLLATSVLTSIAHLGPVDVLGIVSADFTSISSFGSIVAAITSTAAFTSTGAIVTVVSVAATAEFSSNGDIDVSVVVQALAVFTSIGNLSGANAGIGGSATISSIATLAAIGIVVFTRSATITSTSTIVVNASVFFISFTTFTSVAHLVVRGTVSGIGLVVLSPKRRNDTLIAGTGSVLSLGPRRRTSNLTAVRR